MKDEKYIHQWLNKELSNEKTVRLETYENFDELKKITHYTKQIATPNVDVAQAFVAFNNRKKRKILRLNTFYKIAVSILLLLAPTYYFLVLKATTELNTSIAETKSLTLPDNSKVVLNANSKIEYAKYKWSNSRKVILTGEAYFKVAKGKAFTVHTPYGNVQVLGTQFNVKQRDYKFEVVCYEGSVKVSRKNRFEKTLLTGDVFRIMTDQKKYFSKTKMSTPSWIQQESSFTNATLSEVLQELKQYYDIDFVLKKIDTQQLYTGTFTHKNIDVALKTITIPLKIKYTKNNKKVILSTDD